MKFIVVEGANGVGKSTFVEKLKNRLPNCGILKLTGLPGNTDTAKTKTISYYNAVMSYLMQIKDLPGYLILDRCYLSEQVMARLYKKWDFISESKMYTEQLRIAELDIVFIFLGCDTDDYELRLKRSKVEYNNISYEANNSMKQQETYVEIYRDQIPIEIPAYWIWNIGDIDSTILRVLDLIH